MRRPEVQRKTHRPFFIQIVCCERSDKIVYSFYHEVLRTCSRLPVGVGKPRLRSLSVIRYFAYLKDTDRVKTSLINSPMAEPNMLCTSISDKTRT